jgi:hypothetical protein
MRLYLTRLLPHLRNWTEPARIAILLVELYHDWTPVDSSGYFAAREAENWVSPVATSGETLTDAISLPMIAKIAKIRGQLLLPGRSDHPSGESASSIFTFGNLGNLGNAYLAPKA